MNTSKREIWLEEGYHLFAKAGTNSLNIELISRNIGKSKSSFYHYFGDLENYIDELLKLHIKKSKGMSEEIRNCKTIKPDMVNIFLKRKTDVLFHKNLRLEREITKYKNCYEKVFNDIASAMMDKWQSFLGLDTRPMFANTFLYLIADNFLLRVTEANYSEAFLNAYLQELKLLISQME